MERGERKEGEGEGWKMMSRGRGVSCMSKKRGERFEL